MLTILPSHYYSWLLPYNDVYTPDAIDSLAVSGKYPSFDKLIYSIPIALIFGFLRLLLNKLVFSVRKNHTKLQNPLSFIF